MTGLSMATRLCSRLSTLLVRQPGIRIVRKLEMPREFPKRPPFVPLTGYLLLSGPAYFAYQCVYWESSDDDVYHQQLVDASNSLLEVVDLPTE